jgi:hypothetical protein
MLNSKSRKSSRPEPSTPAMDIPSSKNHRRPQRDRPPETSSSSSSLSGPAPGPPLRLVGLPRFHPAAYNNASSAAGASSGASSTSSSSASVASAGRASEQQQHQHQQTPAGQLAYYHQQLLAQISPPPQISITASSAGSAASGGGGGCGAEQGALRPESPKLVPRAGSEGPVTPLELAEADGYMSAGAAGAGSAKKDALGVAASAPCRASA